MPRFFYKAVNTQGRVVKGVMEASHYNDLESRVANMQLELIETRPVKEKTDFGLFRQKVERQERITFTYHLHQLLKAGIPLIDALDDIQDTAVHGPFKVIVQGLVDRISAGKTFSQSLADYPAIFDEVYCHLVAVGERSGQLVDVLADLHDMLKWQNSLITRSKQLLTYPALVFGVVGLVIVFLMVYLVPRLVDFIRLAGDTVPWYTQALISLSELVAGSWWWLLPLSISAVVLMQWLRARSEAWRYTTDRWMIHLWFIGALNYNLKIARFTRYFALMYASGISILDALQLSQKIVANKPLEQALAQVHSQISSGETLQAAFSNVGLFPSLVVRMVQIGQTTGDMSEALMNVSQYYNQEVEDTVKRLEPKVVPVITVILGAMVFWIAASVIYPVLDAVVILSEF